MDTKLEKLIEYSLYFFVFLLPFQTKYIIFSAEQNYNEVAIYLNYVIVLFLSFLFFIYFYQKNKNTKDFEIPKHYLIIIGLDLFIFVSIFVSPILSVSLFKYLLFLFSVSLFFVLLNFNINLRKILLFFILGVFLHSSVAVAQFFLQTDFSNKYLRGSLHDPSVLGTSVIELNEGRFLRSYGLLDHPNILGAVVFFALISVVFLLIKYNFNFWQKISIYFIYFILLLSLLTSFSRSAWLAFSISFLIIFFSLIIKKDKGIFQKFIPFLSYSVLFIVVFLFILNSFIFSRFNLDSRLEEKSINERVGQINYSREIIGDHLWFGSGLGAYHQTLLDANPNLKTYEAQPVHNTFLLVFSEIGLWGFIFFVWFFLYLFKKSLAGENYFINLSLFSGLLIFMIFDHWLWSLPFGLLFLFFILGISLNISSDSYKFIAKNE